ncbi:hypothetical protein ACVWY9_000098 [Thermostichus sp. OS-CIW-31]
MIKIWMHNYKLQDIRLAPLLPSRIPILSWISKISYGVPVTNLLTRVFRISLPKGAIPRGIEGLRMGRKFEISWP